MTGPAEPFEDLSPKMDSVTALPFLMMDYSRLAAGGKEKGLGQNQPAMPTSS